MSATYERARNPVWANAAQTMINLEVDFSFITDEWAPFTASPDDHTSYGPELFARAVAGDFGEIADYVAPPAPPPQPVTKVSRAQALMALHNAGLLESVETMIAAHPYKPVQIWYYNASHWERDHPYLEGIALEIPLTDTQIDALFAAAALLTR